MLEVNVVSVSIPGRIDGKMAEASKRAAKVGRRRLINPGCAYFAFSA